MLEDKKYPSIINEVYKGNQKAKEILLKHSFSVANKALIINQNKNLNLNKEFLFEGAMLHDIGIILVNAPSIYCFGKKPYICHGVLGADILKGTPYEKYSGFCRNHLGVGLTKDEVVNLGIGDSALFPENIYEELVTFTDNFFTKSNLDKELSVQEIKERLKPHGESKVKIFDEFCKKFL